MASAVQNFYCDSNILITGGTGFLGKTLIQKLLLSCEGIEGIYLIVRHKKGLAPAQRLEGVFENPIFDVLKQKVPDFRKKIHLIEADISHDDLGLSSVDKCLLIDKIDIVFHCAAQLNMTESLKSAINVNVKSMIKLIDLCKEIRNLKSAVVVSTAYSNCNQKDVIDEKFYPVPFNIDSLINFIDGISDDLINKITPSLIHPWPNTYVFTKAIAENVLKMKSGNLPMGLYRPSIVTSTYKEPVPGWTDNIYGPAGIMVASGLGLLRVIYSDHKIKSDTIPADLCVNGLICSAYEISKMRLQNENSEIPIYNFSNGSHWNITWKEYIDLGGKCHKNPSMKIIWPQMLIVTPHLWSFYILHFLLHYIPAYIIDGVLFTIGRKPWIIKLYKKLDKALGVLDFFLNHDWEIINSNVQRIWKNLDDNDRNLFPFDTSTVNVEEYMETIQKGLRLYILKESEDTIEAAKRRYRRLVLGQKLFVCVLQAIALWIMYTVICKIFQNYITSQ